MFNKSSSFLKPNLNKRTINLLKTNNESRILLTLSVIIERTSAEDVTRTNKYIRNAYKSCGLASSFYHLPPLYYQMNSLRKLIQENPYSTLSTQVLRNSFLLPTWLGTTLIDQLTWPLNEQMDYIYKIENEHFKGALIMPGIAQSNDDDSAIERLKKADIVIFEIHGKITHEQGDFCLLTLSYRRCLCCRKLYNVYKLIYKLDKFFKGKVSVGCLCDDN